MTSLLHYSIKLQYTISTGKPNTTIFLTKNVLQLNIT